MKALPSWGNVPVPDLGLRAVRVPPAAQVGRVGREVRVEALHERVRPAPKQAVPRLIRHAYLPSTLQHHKPPHKPSFLLTVHCRQSQTKILSGVTLLTPKASPTT